jgi:hypothetical protein
VKILHLEVAYGLWFPHQRTHQKGGETQELHLLGRASRVGPIVCELPNNFIRVVQNQIAHFGVYHKGWKLEYYVVEIGHLGC